MRSAAEIAPLFPVDWSELVHAAGIPTSGITFHSALED
jgi:hypothetical protein